MSFLPRQSVVAWDCEAIVLVHQAKDIARQWVEENASQIPGFAGAFFHGSINWLAGDDVLPPTSDLDLMVVVDDPPPVKLGKFLYRDVLLEVSFYPSAALRSPEEVLGQSHMAGSFRGQSVIADPTGWLTHLQEAVRKDYARERWVRQRCAYARDKALRYLGSAQVSAPFYEQVMRWLFGTGLWTHVLLAAGLENPTVRRRYATARALLAAYGHLDLYEVLLENLGCAWMRREHVARHLAPLAKALDAAKEAIRSPVPFASDLGDGARPIAIEGSRALIATGDHREAVFWVAVTYSRCQWVLDHDAPRAVFDRFDPGYRDLIGDLGIASPSDLALRAEQAKQLLPRVWAAAEAIVAANPKIIHPPKL
jgi:hypothetical protein